MHLIPASICLFNSKFRCNLTRDITFFVRLYLDRYSKVFEFAFEYNQGHLNRKFWT